MVAKETETGTLLLLSLKMAVLETLFEKFKTIMKLICMFNSKEIMQRIHFWWLRRKRKPVHNPLHFGLYTGFRLLHNHQKFECKYMKVGTRHLFSYLGLETLFEYFSKHYKINFYFNSKEIMQRIHFWWLRRKRKPVHNPKWMWISLFVTRRATCLRGWKWRILGCHL